MNPTNPRHLERLIESMKRSREKQEVFRRNRLHALKQYIGSNYSLRGPGERVPYPLLKQALRIYLQNLVASSPRAMITTDKPDLEPLSFSWQEWTNWRTKQIQLDQVLRETVLDACFLLGIVKVGVCYYESDFVQGLRHDYQEVFVDRVSFDDFYLDMAAKRFDQIGYCGDRFRVPLEWARNEPSFRKETRQDLEAEAWLDDNEEGDTRSAALSRDSGSSGAWEDEHEDMTELCEIWLPRDKFMLTLPIRQNEVQPHLLRVIEYAGPKLGPYHLLRFGEVPDQILPSPIAHDLIEIHEAINLILNKAIETAEHWKNILLVPGGTDQDARGIVKAQTGDAVPVTTPGQVQEATFGGSNQALILSVQFLHELANRLGGNLDALGGLGPQTETATQDRMLMESASQLVKDMQRGTIDFTRRVSWAMGWHWWNDTSAIYRVALEDPQMPDFQVQSLVTPEMRRFDFGELNFAIDPYSLQDATPAQQLQMILQLLTTVYMPALPMIQQQGGIIDWQELNRELAAKANLPFLRKLIRFQPPALAPEQEPRTEPPRASPVSSRTTVRVNRPGATSGGKMAVLASAMNGGSPQPAEMASVSRPSV